MPGPPTLDEEDPMAVAFIQEFAIQRSWHGEL
jgi:hypothetical protein